MSFAIIPTFCAKCGKPLGVFDPGGVCFECGHTDKQEDYICDSCKHKDAEWDTEPCDGCCENHSGYEPQDKDKLSEIRERIEDYVCNKEENTLKAQGMLNALRIMEEVWEGETDVT